MIGSRVLLLVLLAGDSAFAGPPDGEDPAELELIERLEHDLGCMCGRCSGMRLADCPCTFAAEERTRIQAMLKERDLSTPETQEAAYRAVVDANVARFGTEDVLVVEAREPDRLGFVIPLAAFLGMIIVFAAAIEIAGRRKRAKESAGKRRRSRRSRSSP